jgi:hypothetical protein
MVQWRHDRYPRPERFTKDGALGADPSMTAARRSSMTAFYRKGEYKAKLIYND